MMDTSAVLAFAGAVFIVTIKPGPGVLAMLSRSLADGWKQGAALALGLWALHMTFLTVATLTFVLVKDYLDFAVILFKALGAVLMIHLGVKEFGKINQPLVTASAGAAHFRDYLKNFWTGVSINIGNPLMFFFYAAILPATLDVATLRPIDLLTCYGVLIVFNLGTLISMAVGADSVRAFLTDLDKARHVRMLVGTMFILIGLLMGLSALPFIDWADLYFRGS